MEQTQGGGRGGCDALVDGRQFPRLSALRGHGRLDWSPLHHQWAEGPRPHGHVDGCGPGGVRLLIGGVLQKDVPCFGLDDVLLPLWSRARLFCGAVAH